VAGCHGCKVGRDGQTLWARGVRSASRPLPGNGFPCSDSPADINDSIVGEQRLLPTFQQLYLRKN
jgi:hypothetical protein